MTGAINPRVKAILDQVGQLTEDERMELEDEMLLGKPGDEAIEQAWAEECARRVEDLRTGCAKAIPLEAALAELDARSEARARARMSE